MKDTIIVQEQRPNLPLLDRIADYTLFHAMRMQDNGLYHGKAGVALALLCYANYRDNELLQRMANDILDEATRHLDLQHTYGLEFGLSGIAYAMTLLYKKGLFDGDLSECLSDIDKAIMEYNPEAITDASLRTGILGLWCYISQRELIGENTYSNTHFFNSLVSITKQGSLNNSAFRLEEHIDKPTFEAKDFLNQPIALSGGSAYYLYQASK